MSVFLADEQTEQVGLDELRALAESVLRHEGYPEQAEVTILLVSESEMASYNQKFLDRDGPTDVLAFPIEELRPGRVPEHDRRGPPLMLGDVIVAPSYVRRQAVELGVTFDDEIALMVTHGILHLLGYDHVEDDDAERMEAKERELLVEVGRSRR
ncbi:MAG TPA: rRNA maturation RNase YbeY [Acidimicrobiia bacterium]|nr:rRNA maturation RNase YbeY [Acidimicrobiia bacterium]